MKAFYIRRHGRNTFRLAFCALWIGSDCRRISYSSFGFGSVGVYNTMHLISDHSLGMYFSYFHYYFHPHHHLLSVSLLDIPSTTSPFTTIYTNQSKNEQNSPIPSLRLNPALPRTHLANSTTPNPTVSGDLQFRQDSTGVLSHKLRLTLHHLRGPQAECADMCVEASYDRRKCVSDGKF